MLRPDRFKSLRIFLFPLALFYRAMIFWRNFFYNIGFFVSKRLSCKIISIGNISVGGTGKTPAVIYIAELLQDRGKHVAVLSRGYARKSKGTVLVSDGKGNVSSWIDGGDEPVLIAHKIPQIPIVADENRVRGGTYLIDNFNPDFILLDDAFQHRAIERDLDIVLINSQIQEKMNKLLPYGLLREPKNQLKRADIIFLTKTNLGEFEPSLSASLDVPVFKSFMVTQSILKSISGDTLGIDAISAKNVFAVSGLGDPESFHSSITRMGAHISGHYTKPDHYNYSDDDVNKIIKHAQQTSADLIITTEKDLVKLGSFNWAELPVLAIPIRFEPEETGRKKLLQLLNLE